MARITTATALAVGQGVPINVPVRLLAINPSSGAESTFSSYAESGVSGGGCASNMNSNSPTDPNPTTDTGDNASVHTAMENNEDQINQFAVDDFPSPDYVDQAIESSTTLYIESNGVNNPARMPAARPSTAPRTPV